MLNNIGIYHYLILGFILFLTGLCGVVLSRNVIKILISIEFMLTAVNINFTTFGLYCKNLAFDGYIFAIPVAYYFFVHFCNGTNVFIEFFNYLKGAINVYF